MGGAIRDLSQFYSNGGRNGSYRIKKAMWHSRGITTCHQYRHGFSQSPAHTQDNGSNDAWVAGRYDNPY